MNTTTRASCGVPTQQAVGRRLLLIAAVLTCLLRLAWPAIAADPDRPRAFVEQGLRQYHQGAYSAAAEAFREAAESQTASAVLQHWATFNRACALAAQGQTEAAVVLWKETAGSSQAELAAASQYNLGYALVQQGVAALGADPLSAEPAARQDAWRQLEEGIGRFRNCLRLQPAHQAARKNLELTRVWMYRMQQQWLEQQRQQEQFLAWVRRLEELRKQQLQLRSAAWGVMQLDPDDVGNLAGHIAGDQRQLARDARTLREELQQMQQATPSGGSSPTFLEPVEQAMAQAADAAEARQWGPTRERQATSLNQLQQALCELLPYEVLLPRAIDQQQDLIAATVEARDLQAEAAPRLQPPDWEELSRSQREFVWIAPALAKQASQPAAAAPSGPGAGSAAIPDSTTAEMSRLAEQASRQLELQQADQALPDQQRILELLRQLPPPQPDGDQPDQEQQQQPRDGGRDSSSQSDQENSEQSGADQQQGAAPTPQRDASAQPSGQQDPAAPDQEQPQPPSEPRVASDSSQPPSSDDRAASPTEPEQDARGESPDAQEHAAQEPGQQPTDPTADQPSAEEQQPKGSPGEATASPTDEPTGPGEKESRLLGGVLTGEQLESLLQRVRQREQTLQDYRKRMRMRILKGRPVERDW